MAQKAVFDHVDNNGVVILKVGDEQVELEDSDDFEQGLLAAKQLKAEARTDALPPETEGLPISQIQNLARAGVTTDKIAAKYGMEPALIRRFAEPIEQEKKSAIAQFLTVNIRQNEEVHRLGELINSTLVAAGVDTAGVEWTASRNKREPWRISALFPHNNRMYKATWSWNMRDNAVVAIDPTAKKLLGQSDADARDLLFGDEGGMSISTDVPQSGPNPPSWMIEGGRHHDEPETTESSEEKQSNMEDGQAADEDDTRLFTPLTAQESEDETRALSPLEALRWSPQEDSGRGGAARNPDTADGSTDDDRSAPSLTDKHPDDGDLSSSPAGTHEGSAHRAANGTESTVSATKAGSSRGQSDDRDDGDDSQKSSHTSRRGNRPKSRRNAIPSWDDIIFGD